jgi:hypothetical protein
VLEVLAERSLLKGNTIGVDATTLEANAALRSIVRRDTGKQYNEFLTRLAEESGIRTPTREQLARLDQKRRRRDPTTTGECVPFLGKLVSSTIHATTGPGFSMAGST